MLTRERSAQYLRNTIFGIEDSLVSTVGLLSGVAVVGTDTKTIILAGVVLIFVEAFSMGMGSLLSEHSAEEFEAGRDLSMRQSILPGFVMFISYFIAGFIPLTPYLFFPTAIAFPSSITAALIALFFLGVASAKLSRTRLVRNGLRMLILGGIAILLGVFVGTFVNTL